jgi:thiamine pyrophosphate-dependent acetolactate synthase large subunit-like protein
MKMPIKRSATKLFPDATVVRIDIEAHEIDRNRSSEVGLVGDIRTNL